MKKLSKKREQPQQFLRWFIRFRLKNGMEECYAISATEKERLSSIVSNICEAKGIDFIEFDSKTHRICIQTSQLMFFQFLFEPPCIELPQTSCEDEEEDPELYAVKIYPVDSPNPMTFYVDIDVPNPQDEGDQGEMNNFLYFLLHTSETDQWVNFTDEDGEVAFFRADRIALAEIPLKAL